MDGQRGERVARSEMDNFFLCLDEEREEGVQRRVNLMEEAINRRLSLMYSGTHLTFAVGCCLVTDETVDIRTLQDRARIAAQDEQAAVRDRCVFYSDSIVARIKREQELNAMFQNALDNGEFQVYLQPKVNLSSGRLAGAEALVRWIHPVLGAISPGDFIPLFERSGKICQLDFYVFEEVCRFYQRRQSRERPWYPVSVNLSRSHFYEDDFLDRFYEVYRRYGLPEHSIEFELTESMFVDSTHQQLVKQGIDRMHRMGFLCSMDDFGSGYSSLSVLREFDVDALKMDRAFFLDTDSEKAQSIIRSVMELASKLRMETVAEGIEEEDQIAFLRSVHCDIVQGYFFSKPLPMDEFEHWVNRYEIEEPEHKK